MARRGGSAQSTVLGALAVFSFFCAVVAGISMVTASSEDAVSWLPWVLGFSLFVVLALVFIWRLSPFTATLFFTGMSTMLAGLMALLIGRATTHHTLVTTIGALSAAACVGGAVTLLRLRRKTSDVGNPLSVLASVDPIFEFNGIQFVADTRVAPWGGVLRMLLQNCYDAPRTLTVTLNPTSGDAERQVTSIPVPPLGVLRVEIPCVVRTGVAVMNLRLGTAGLGGTRRRTWEARTYENKAGLATKLAIHALGVMVPTSEGASLRFAAGPESGGPPRAHTIVDLTQTTEVAEAIRKTGGLA